MKGGVSASEHSTFRDSITGATIHQLTTHPSINHPAYFLHSSFTPDDRHVLFTSYRTGTPQLFEAGFPDGAIRQLTEGPPIHPFSPMIHPCGELVFFVRAGSIFAVDLRTLEERQVVDFARAQLGECSLDAGGNWLAAAGRRGDDRGLVVGRIDGSGWRWIPFERTVIHPQFHPCDPHWLIFAADPAPRMHRVRRDGSSLECLHRHGNDEFVVHETFLGNTGDLVFVVWPFALRRMRWDSLEISTIAEFNAWHIAANRAGDRILCDTNHPDRGLFLMDAESGARKLLCQSGSSNRGSQWKTSRYALKADFEAARTEDNPGREDHLSWMESAADSVYGPQWTHPHPSFSRNERLAAFASDRTGHTQVYVVEIG